MLRRRAVWPIICKKEHDALQSVMYGAEGNFVWSRGFLLNEDEIRMRRTADTVDISRFFHLITVNIL